ncbi:MAG: cupin domain-containing protein [Sedimentisphaerales bacterium]|nr:cupin domain-containing protein [Sedimentisphaerales bacterium]
MSKEAFVIDLENSNEYQSLLKGRPQTYGMRSGRVFLEKDKACGRHSTNAHEEILVFLSGRGQALIGDENSRYEVGEGKILYIPPHTFHDIMNSATEPLVYIYCVAPISQSE